MHGKTFHVNINVTEKFTQVLRKNLKINTIYLKIMLIIITNCAVCALSRYVNANIEDQCTFFQIIKIKLEELGMSTLPENTGK